MSEIEQRERVIAEARAWIGTPYHTLGRIRGVGADCATFPAEVYAAAGVIPPVEIGFYPPDWHLNQDGERYLQRVLNYATEVTAPQPGDFALWRIGHALAHGAIIVAWPKIIHAVFDLAVIEDLGTAPMLRLNRRGNAKREHHFYSPWAKAPEAAAARAAA